MKNIHSNLKSLRKDLYYNIRDLEKSEVTLNRLKSLSHNCASCSNYSSLVSFNNNSSSRGLCELKVKTVNSYNLCVQHGHKPIL